MRGLLWLIGLFALAAGLAVAGRYNEGYALLVWPPYRIQISLNLLILLLVGAFAAAYSLSRLVARTMALPRAVQQFRARKSRERASQAIYDAVRRASRRAAMWRCPPAWSSAMRSLASSKRRPSTASLASVIRRATRVSPSCSAALPSQ